MNEGHLKFLGLLFTLLAIAAILPSASADSGAMNASLQTASDTLWIRYHNQSVQTPASICAVYGQGVYSGYTNTFGYTFFTTPYTTQDATGTQFFEANVDGFPGSLPTTWNLSYYPGSPLYISVGQYALCADGVGHIASKHRYYNATTFIPAPVANFTGTPTSGVPPLASTMTDSSTNLTGTETWNWSVSPPTAVIDNPTSQNTAMHFMSTGNYTITHGVSNVGGSSIMTRTEYIYVYNSTAQYTSMVQATNIMTGTAIHGAVINILDVENNSWTNTTTSFGIAYVTALAGHHGNAYGSALGFRDGEYLGFPIDGKPYSIDMVPDTNVTNVSAGNITLYVNVKDYSTALPIQGAGVAATWNTGQWNIVTNAAGSAAFIVPNKTMVTVGVAADGYKSATQTTYTGTGSGGSSYVSMVVSLMPNTLGTPTVTPVVTICDPTCHVVTPAQTIDPYPCDADHPDNCQRKETDMGNMLVMWGPSLISFFIVLTFVGGIKLMGK